MPFAIKWTRRASLDLSGIKAHIAQDQPAAAMREVGDILRKVDLLVEFPQLGPVFRHTGDIEYRAVFSGNYRIIYRIRREGPVIDIITVRHGAQDEPELH